MRYTSRILIATGVLLLLSMLCLPNFGVAEEGRLRGLSMQMVQDFEKRMTDEELTRLFEIPPSEKDRRGFMRRKLTAIQPHSSYTWYWILESASLGIGLIGLGLADARSDRKDPEAESNIR